MPKLHQLRCCMSLGPQQYTRRLDGHTHIQTDIDSCFVVGYDPTSPTKPKTKKKERNLRPQQLSGHDVTITLSWHHSRVLLRKTVCRRRQKQTVNITEASSTSFVMTSCSGKPKECFCVNNLHTQCCWKRPAGTIKWIFDTRSRQFCVELEKLSLSYSFGSNMHDLIALLIERSALLYFPKHRARRQKSSLSFSSHLLLSSIFSAALIPYRCSSLALPLWREPTPIVHKINPMVQPTQPNAQSTHIQFHERTSMHAQSWARMIRYITQLVNIATTATFLGKIPAQMRAT